MGWQRPGISVQRGVVEREGVMRLKELPSYERLQNIPARSSNRAPVHSTSFDCLPNLLGKIPEASVRMGQTQDTTIA